MSEFTENRQNLYNNLIDDGYFRSDDGEINFSFEDFSNALDDQENVETFYNNLISDGYFRDEDGDINFPLEDFREMVGCSYEKLAYYPITENQRGVFVDWEMNRDALQYNIVDVKKIDGVSVDALRNALIAVIDAHPYIKTRMEMVDGDIMQKRRDEAPAIVTEVEMPECKNAEETRKWFQARVRPFDLFEDDLYRMEIRYNGNNVWLFVDIHHIIFDGGSSLVLFNDLETILNGGSVKPETYTAFDRALEEQKMFAGEEFCHAEEYFKNLLADYEVASYPHSAVPDSPTPSSKHVTTVFPRTDIFSYCCAHGITENSFFMAVTGLVLNRLTRQNNTLFTSITHGRVTQNMQNIFGMFVQTMPVVSRISDSSFEDVVKQIHNQYIATQGNSIYSYTRIVEKYGLHSEVMFAYQGGFDYTADASESVSSELDTVKLPLMITVLPQGNDYCIDLEYDASLYSKSDMDRLASAISVYSLNAVSGKSVPVNKIAVVDEKIAAQLQKLGAGAKLEHDVNETLVDIMHRQATENPDSVYVVFEDRSYTFKQIDEITDRIARYIVSIGVQHEQAVGVMITRSELIIIYSIAVMKAGCAYMPLDPHFPEDRLAFMCDDANVKIILTEDSLIEETMPGFAGTVVKRDELKWAFDGTDCYANQVLPNVKAEDRMVILYTSGSTGKPKGVELEQHGIVNFCYWYVKEFGMTSEDRAVGYANYGFDAHMIDIYPTILAGAATYILPEEMRLDLTTMNDYIEQNHLSIAFMTTQIGCQMATMFDNKSLRVLSTGGEKMPPITPPSYRFVNPYGPTECSLFSTFYDVRSYFEGEFIGRALDNYQLYIVDKYMQLVPEGVPGELLICGTGVARGYLNRPKMTAEKFITYNGQKGYRSGDLVRWAVDPRDGSRQIEFMGRIDNQVKLRGLRIELGEIENRVVSYPGIRQACVDVKEIGGNQNLVCYYVPFECKEIDIEDLKKKLGEELASFMVPELYVKLDTMPLTPNGKVDRRALPLPEMCVDAVDLVPPSTDIEERLYAIVAKLLKTDSFGVTTNLIGMGLTSLLAMRLSALIKQETDKVVKTKDILKSPDIRSMAALMDSNDADHSLYEANVYDKRKYYPVTENQRGIYVDWEMNRNTTQYNIPLVKQVTGVGAEELRSALIAVVEAHPYLKNRFEMHGDDIVQVRNEDEPTVVDLVVLEEEPSNDYLQSKVVPFNLLTDRLYRIEVVKSPASVYLFMDVHHTIFDGGSQFVFLSELEKALNGETLEKETYTAWDRALDEQKMMQSHLYDEAKEYFDRTLGEAEVANYPTSSEAKESGNRACRFDKCLNASEVTEFCHKNNITENSFFMAVTSLVLQRLTREENLIFTSISNGRNNVSMISIMGMFVKTLPVVSVPAKGMFVEYAKQIQQQYILTQDYGSVYPYTQLVSRFPANPEILFAYQGGMGASTDSSNDNDTTVDLDTAKMPLMFTVYPSGDDYSLALEYSSDRYVEEDMRKLADVFLMITHQACDEAKCIENYLLVSESEKASLISLGKGRQLDYDTTETLVSIIRRQAKRIPDNIYIVFCNRSYTYSQVDEITDRIAAHLINQGVRHEQAIGVMIERSELMIIYSIAVMKAGGTYMPLDSHFPEERLMFMCEDAEVNIILSDPGLVNKVLPSYTGIVFTSDEIEALPEADVVWPEVKAEDRMVILYTSGSTGKPKGVELEQHGIVNFCYWYLREFEMTSADKAAAYANYGFDAHMIDIYPAMLAGAPVYIFADDIRMDLYAMNEYIEQNGITIAFMTTQIGCQMATIFNNKSFRLLSVGGEKMPAMDPPAYRFVNGYGPTECSMYSTTYNVKSHFEGEFIGTPLDNYQLYIVDKNMQLVPEGVPGELLICGTGVARGYLNRPKMTAEKFITYNGQKGYRSGDLVRWSVDPRDGSKQIEFMGRIDKQVKLRGLRIELGEIENKVSSFPGIRQVCVDVKEMGGSQNLVCYYVTQDNVYVDIQSLKARLSEELTAFMIPEFYVRLDSMPFTPNGKINRKALPMPEDIELAHELPLTESEQTLFDIVKEVLGHDRFGVTDDLRKVGLSSIMAIKVIAMAKRKDIDIKVDELLKCHTIRGVLNIRQTFVYWSNYDEQKPVVVLVQGETAFIYLSSYLNALSEHFSVLVVESIKSHFNELFSQDDFNEVIEMYHSMIDLHLFDIDNQLVAFTGHCFGGDLCYRLANRWRKDHPELHPAVCLLDSFWLDCNREYEKIEFDESVLPDIVLAQKKFFDKEAAATMDMYRALRFCGAPEKYDGKVCMFRAMRAEQHVRTLSEKTGISIEELTGKYGMTDSILQKVLLPIRAFDNEAMWRGYLPGIECFHVEADHLTMLDENLVGQYVDWIKKSLRV